jgi:WD40 repeat protein
MPGIHFSFLEAKEAPMFRAFWLLSSFLAVGLVSLHGDPVKTQANQDLPAADINQAWSDLAGADAAKAFQAIVSLIQKRQEAVAFLVTHLPPAARPNPRQVEQWIKDLNSPRFADRDRGSRELEKLGGLAEQALRKALLGELALEVRQRVDKLLLKLTGPLQTPEQLRAVRAVEILEHIGSNSSRRLLKKYAAGAAGARLTEDAKEAVRRLEKSANSLAWAPRGKAVADLYGDRLPAGAVARLGSTRFRRDSFGIMGLAFLPDNKTIVTADQGHAVQLWEAASGRLLRELRTEPLSIMKFALAPGGKQFAVAGSYPWIGPNQPSPTEIRVIDLASGKVVQTLARKNNQDVYNCQLTFSPDGKLLFSLGYSGVLRIEEIATGKELVQKKFSSDYPGGIVSSPDGKYLAIASGPNSRKLYLWKWRDEEPRQLQGPEYGVGGICFSPDGKLLAGIGDHGANLRLWEIPSGRLLVQRGFSDSGYYLASPAFTPDGKTLAVPLIDRNGSGRGKIQLLEPRTAKPKATLEGAGAGVTISADSRYLACSFGQGIRIWDLASQKELGPKHEGHSSEATQIIVSPKGFLATASDDNTVRLWDAATSRQKRHFSVDGWVRAIALSPDGKLLAASSFDDRVHLWNTATGKEIYRLAGHGRYGGKRTLGFLPDGNGLLSWGDDLYLRLWDMKNGKARFEHAIRPTGVKIPDPDQRDRKEDFLFRLGGGDMTPDGKTFIWHIDGNYYLFDVATGKETRKFPTASSIFSNSTISADSKRLLVSSNGSYETKNHLVFLIDLAYGKVLQQFPLPGSNNGPVAFSADGRVFATSVDEPQKAILLYEIASGKVRYAIRGYRGAVRSLAFFPDGSRLASGHRDSTVLIWDLNSPPEMAKGK